MEIIHSKARDNGNPQHFSNSSSSDPTYDLGGQNYPWAQSIETLEHLQALSGLSEEQWLDLLQLSWRDYYSFRSRQRELNSRSLENLAQHFKLAPEHILSGTIDFKKLSVDKSPKNSQIPDYYMVAPHGRLRSTITSLDFLESSYGWRLKTDILKKFNIYESQIRDAFAPISMRLITDICEYLHKRQFGPQDFFQMGVYSYQGNRNSLISHLYSKMENFEEAIEALFTEVMPLFEHNCHYSYEKTKEGMGIVTVQSIPEVANELSVKALGNPHICQFKGGVFASTALYFGLNLPKVTHTKCEHKGNSCCQYVLDFSFCTPITEALSPGSFSNQYFCN